MARKPTSYTVQINNDGNTPLWHNIATCETVGTANFIAKLWQQHIERTDPDRTGTQFRVIEDSSSKLIWLLVVNPTNETCAHKDHRRTKT